ncbi:signal peptide containing protein [Theileria equi strain WA]|uniref:Signal peptide containing protein n=1 Tax=Theileria equi strain WA TaxID=1537102 RepID=L1LE06_THEEQ|nr:signal peptide containing protein [Theileria equi strain WA]EKX73514.1 signal peptide containing protein [Theileria equi strain WA]|eukprot:XP_004832966.1 signal peptide containing protein [Theileria equi strain WA]
MRVLAVLWIIFLARLCYCGDDLEVKNLIEDTEQESYELEEHAPLSDLKVKVDESLFNVENGQENGIKILRLTVKNGTPTNELTFDGQTVWEGKKKLCSSTVLYMDGEKPTLAVLVTRDKNNKQGKVYRYHDGKQWKDEREFQHKSKLATLMGETLDLSNPDTSKLDVHTENAYGVSLKEYTPKSAFHISSLTDGDKELWKAGTGEISGFVTSCTRGDSSLITIGINKDDGSVLDLKYFEKVEGD